MHPRHIWKELFTPSMEGLVFYLFASITILVGSTSTSIINQITTPDNRLYFDQLLHQYTAATFSRFDQPGLIGRLTVFLLWAGIGAIAYVLVWMAINIYISIRNNIVIGTLYMSFDQRGHATYWWQLTARAAFRFCAIVLVLLLAAVVVQIWYPVSITMFKTWTTDFRSLYGWALVFEAFWGWFVVFHVGAIILRLLFLRTRLFAEVSYTS